MLRCQNLVFRNFSYKNLIVLQETYNCFKTYFSRIFTKGAFYKGYKNFDRLTFNRGIGEKLNQQTNEYKYSKQIFIEVQNIYASMKRKLLRAIHVFFK